MKRIRKAVFPVAGLGTRFLPATKSVPKELLPIVDRPLIQYAIDEARAAGIEEFVFVTSKGKTSIEDYCDTNAHLEAALKGASKSDLLEIVQATNLHDGELISVRQPQPKGLGHAIWCARTVLGDEPFAVILPDDVIAAEQPCLKQMMEAYEMLGGSIVAAMEIPEAETFKYGMLDVDEDHGTVVSLNGMVEKPKPGTAPSNLAIVGRYILEPSVLTHINGSQCARDAEIQITDAIAADITAQNNVYGFKFRGTRFDCGSKQGLLQANIAFALRRPDLGVDLHQFLHGMLGTRVAAE